MLSTDKLLGGDGRGDLKFLKKNRSKYFVLKKNDAKFIIILVHMSIDLSVIGPPPPPPLYSYRVVITYRIAYHTYGAYRICKSGVQNFMVNIDG